MKYKQITGLKANESFIADFLAERNISDLDEFINPGEEHLYDYLLLDNIVEGARLLLHHVENCSNIFLVPDCDVDGFTSSSMMYLYLKQINPSLCIDWTVHEGKQHGAIDLVDYILNLDVRPDLIILPDASSNEEAVHEIFQKEGIDVLVIDHHMCDNGYSKYATVINNQLSEKYPNKSLCGAGVVYKFLCCLDDMLQVHFANDYLDLAAVGMIGDMMNLCDLESRYIIKQGLSNIHNLALMALCEKQSYSMNNQINPTSIAFYIVPLINALIRVGTHTEKENLFKAFVNPNVIVPSTKRGHKEGDTETVCAQAVRTCVNAKSRQDRAKNKILEEIDMMIQKEGLDQHKIIIANVSEGVEFDSNLTGLIAMGIATKYKRPTCVVRETPEGLLKGSGRGLSNCPISDFRQFLLDSQKCDYAMGHGNAFGISIPNDYLTEVLNYADKELADVQIDENVYDVDLIIEGNNSNLVPIILKLGTMEEVWGQGQPQPLFAIEKINLNKKDISFIGADSSTLKFEYNGVVYVKFKDKKAVEDFSNYENLEVTVVGKANLNEWAGQVTPQIIIENYEIHDNTYDF